MSGSGRIVAVQQRQDYRGSRPVLWLLTDFDAPVGPDRLKRNAVQIEPIIPAPAIGDLIAWGPHEVEWNGRRLPKIAHEFDPNDPRLYTG